jgi:small subunit ribosomal protein S1
VIEVVKGGLILDLGVRGFLPASLVDIRRVQDLDEFMGQELRCKVIELNRSRNNVVLSRRAVLEDERKDSASRFSTGSTRATSSTARSRTSSTSAPSST